MLIDMSVPIFWGTIEVAALGFDPGIEITTTDSFSRLGRGTKPNNRISGSQPNLQSKQIIGHKWTILILVDKLDFFTLFLGYKNPSAMRYR